MKRDGSRRYQPCFWKRPGPVCVHTTWRATCRVQNVRGTPNAMNDWVSPKIYSHVCLPFLRFSWAWKGNKYSAGTLATFLDAPPCHTTTPHPHHVVAVSQCRAVPVAVSLFRCVARPWRKDVKKAYREACSTTIPILYNWYVVNSWRNPSITNATAAHSTLTMNHHKSMPTRHKQTNKTITSNPWLWFERNLVLMLVTSFTKFSFYNIYIYIHIYINTHTHTHYK